MISICKNLSDLIAFNMKKTADKIKIDSYKKFIKYFNIAITDIFDCKKYSSYKIEFKNNDKFVFEIKKL